jgi:hypothetical protein
VHEKDRDDDEERGEGREKLGVRVTQSQPTMAFLGE